MEAIVFYLLIVQKIYQFKAKDSDIKIFLFCLENIAGGFSAKNMKKKKTQGVYTIFMLIIQLLLVILSISINI